MNRGAQSVIDGVSVLFLSIGVIALYAVGMWPMNDTISYYMKDGDWQIEAFRRFLILIACSFGTCLFFLIGHLALFRIFTIGSKQRAKRWAKLSLLTLMFSTIVIIIRFLIVRPWF